MRTWSELKHNIIPPNILPNENALSFVKTKQNGGGPQQQQIEFPSGEILAVNSGIVSLNEIPS